MWSRRLGCTRASQLSIKWKCKPDPVASSDFMYLEEFGCCSVSMWLVRCAGDDIWFDLSTYWNEWCHVSLYTTVAFRTWCKRCIIRCLCETTCSIFTLQDTNIFFICIFNGTFRWEEEYTMRMDLQQKIADLQEVTLCVFVCMWGAGAQQCGMSEPKLYFRCCLAGS